MDMKLTPFNDSTEAASAEAKVLLLTDCRRKSDLRKSVERVAVVKSMMAVVVIVVERERE
jgi:hypothetical protein